MSFPNPYNPRQRLAPVSQMVDPDAPKPDGEVFPDDPSLSRMGNVVRYMRGHERYMPPNPWPEGMFLYGFDAEGLLACAFIMPLYQFEVISEEELFGACNQKTVRLYFVPSLEFPPSDEAAKAQIDNWLDWIRVTPEEFNRQTLYLAVNNWYVDKHDTGTPGSVDSVRTCSGGDHQGGDPDEFGAGERADPGGGKSDPEP